MLELGDKMKQTVEQAVRIMDEYRHRLSEILEEEIERIKQEAGEEVAAFLVKALETAQQTSNQVSLEAETYRTELRQKAEDEATES